jgi:hypothetical protein
MPRQIDSVNATAMYSQPASNKKGGLSVALFKRRARPSYTPLLEPAFDRWPVPDMGLLRRDGQMINLLVETALDRAKKIDSDAPSLPILAALEAQLVEVLSRDSPAMREAMKGPLYYGARVGYVLGLMENQGGVAKAGQCEGHYWTALGMLWARGPTESFSDEVGYAHLAGYYVARVGELALSPTVEKAVAWAASQGQGDAE